LFARTVPNQHNGQREYKEYRKERMRKSSKRYGRGRVFFGEKKKTEIEKKI
jgi:hypothetical protein